MYRTLAKDGQAEDDIHMQEHPDSASDIPNTNQDDPECVCCNVNAQTDDNSSGSDSSESDSEESDSSHNVIRSWLW